MNLLKYILQFIMQIYYQKQISLNQMLKSEKKAIQNQY